MKNLIIVTGGAGFVGSGLIELFLKKTNHRTLDIVPMELLKDFAIDLN